MLRLERMEVQGFKSFYGRTRFDFPGGSYEMLIESISSKILSLSEDMVVYPGHGPATNVGQEKRTNPFFI